MSEDNITISLADARRLFNLAQFTEDRGADEQASMLRLAALLDAHGNDDFGLGPTAYRDQADYSWRMSDDFDVVVEPPSVDPD